MSSVASFKQTCPSCGGHITIKNPELIGKKVDCPKCKYRFVVESPDGADQDAAPGEANGAPARKAAGRKSPGRIRDGEDDRRGRRRKEEKEGGNKGLLILAGVGVGVFLIVAVVLVFALLSGGDNQPVAKTTPGKTGPSQLSKPDPNAEIDELINQLDNDATREDAKKKLMDKLETASAEDVEKILSKLKDKAMAGSAQDRKSVV